MLGKKQPSLKSPDLQHYLGRPNYDPAEYIALVECCCNDDMKRKFLSSKLTTTLGSVVTRWKTDDRTKGLRVLVVLALGGCCFAFDQPRHVARPNDSDAERFLRHFCQLVRRLGQNFDADPKPLEIEWPRDTTLDLEAEGVRDLLNAVGVARISSPLFEALATSSRAPMLIEKRTALIVVAQIALLRPVGEGAQKMPRVMSMVLANGFGRVLTVFDSGPQEAVVPPRVSGLTKNKLIAFATFDLSESVCCKDNWSADCLVVGLFSIKAVSGETAGEVTVATAVTLGNSYSIGTSSSKRFSYVTFAEMCRPWFSRTLLRLL